MIEIEVTIRVKRGDEVLFEADARDHRPEEYLRSCDALAGAASGILARAQSTLRDRQTLHRRGQKSAHVRQMERQEAEEK